MIDLIFIKGLKRSGNHLIINWLLHHYKNPIFINDINPLEKLDFNLIQSKIDLIKINENTDCVLVSIEVPYLLNKNNNNIILNQLIKNINPKNINEFLIIRDPFNWYCSQLIKDFKTYNIKETKEKIINRSNKIRIKLWSNYLDTMNNWSNINFIINYNVFLKCDLHKIEILNKLNKKIDKDINNKILNTLWQPKELNLVSSFDDNDINSGKLKPKNMDVLNRYQNYKYLFNNENTPKKIINICNTYWPDIKNDIFN